MKDDKKFSLIIKPILENEGGWTKLDGGTYRGIVRGFHPNWSGWKVIDDLLSHNLIAENVIFPELEPQVQEFYRKEFYDKSHVGLIDAPVIAYSVLDHAVNRGISSAIRLLQITVNAALEIDNNNNTILVDGILGAQTANAVNYLCKEMGSLFFFFFFARYRCRNYAQLCLQCSTFAKYLPIWILRACKVPSL
jgi:lysozyme family protein